MFTFKVQNRTDMNVYHCSIEGRTHLLVVEWEVDGEEYPRYIRMTAQQIEKLKGIIFGGAFTSTTIPYNKFSLDKDIVLMSCPEERQVIKMPINGIIQIYRYYEKHKDMIAKMDCQFRSRR